MKAINAYLVEEGKTFHHNDYGTPIDEENQERAHRNKCHTVQIRIDNLPDGIYRFVEAGGADNTKLVKGYLKIANGEVVEESQNLSALIVGEQANTLPELEGSQKQIDWALSIREKAIAKFNKANGEIPETLTKTTSAKWFIENKDSL
ncbi:MAG: hypothetical protein AN483_19365 [Aphanizomenon flos-aquae MDT14a]|jgi:hypothetical protein|uniref:Uncharacterized protein n=1 Tax=Aphanizomenon flos-aquae WA102 TaxID=1710896 RepID=A0A1B7WZ90_APHFL|nr:MAG: hypothetical protein AN483_19365 [Aphanizomenon flos-aquae MDT14a]OBQ42429.1 MAG: hypothetical protein AN484_17685 [Aphanizomenon flos-aquae WA102]